MALRRQAVVPLLDIQSQEFAKQYESGVWWSMHGEEQSKGLLSVTYLVTNLKNCVKRGLFDEQQNHWHDHLGFYIGMYHGRILSPETGHPRPDATTLAVLSTDDAHRGYFVGREHLFTELEPRERRYTETQVLDYMDCSVREMTESHDPDQTWLYSMGCLLGELSGQLFPVTEQDYQIWTKIHREHEEAFRRWKTSLVCATEPPPTVVTLQEA